MKVTGVVLAGGQSKRMGQNKALMPFKSSTLIEQVLATLCSFTDEQIIIGDPEIYCRFGTVYADVFPGKGPLGGLHSALLNSNTDLNFVVGCDMPKIDRSIFDHLLGHDGEEYDAFVPIHAGQMEPLCALYSKKCLDHFADCLEQDMLKLSDAFSGIRVKFVQVGPGTEIDDLDVFKNLNLPEDIEQ